MIKQIRQQRQHFVLQICEFQSTLISCIDVEKSIKNTNILRGSGSTKNNHDMNEVFKRKNIVMLWLRDQVIVLKYNQSILKRNSSNWFKKDGAKRENAISAPQLRLSAAVHFFQLFGTVNAS